MKRCILLGIALALSSGSCRDSTFAGPGDPDGAALAYASSDRLTDPGTLEDDPEVVVIHSLTILITDLNGAFASWEEEDLHTFVNDELQMAEYSESFFASGSRASMLQDLSSAIALLAEEYGQVYVGEFIAAAIAEVSPVDPPDNTQSVETPCYDEFQTKGDQAGVALGACVAATSATMAGPAICLLVYTATMAIYTREFYRCVLEGN